MSDAGSNGATSHHVDAQPVGLESRDRALPQSHRYPVARGDASEVAPYTSNIDYVRDCETEVVMRVQWYLANVTRTVDDEAGAAPRKPGPSIDAIEHAERNRRMRLAVTTVELAFPRLVREIGLTDVEERLVAYLLFLREGVRVPAMIEAVDRSGLSWSSARVALAVATGRLDACFTNRGLLAADAPLFKAGLLAPLLIDRMDALPEIDLTLNADAVASLLDDAVTLSHLSDGIRVVRPTETLDGLIVDERVGDLLRRIAGSHGNFMHARRALGLDDLLTYGGGTVLLFQGPPGTGKTLAARALAGSMKRPLVLVDAVEASGKEDRLAVALTEARRQDGILFLDEFEKLNLVAGSGTERRFLALLERATEIVILATNVPVLSDALARRILHRVNFRLPDEPQRRAIWARHIPPGVECPDAALDEVARIPWLAGGHIKNAALDALQAAVAERDSDDGVRLDASGLRRAALEQYERIEQNFGSLFSLPLPVEAPGVPAVFARTHIEDVATLVRGLVADRTDQSTPPLLGIVAPDEKALTEGAGYLAAALKMPLFVLGGERSISRLRDLDEDRINALLRAVSGSFVALSLAPRSATAESFGDSGLGMRIIGQLPALMIVGCYSSEPLASPRFAEMLARLEAAPDRAARNGSELLGGVESFGLKVGAVDWQAVLTAAGGLVRSPAALCRVANAHARSRGAALPETEDFLFAVRLQGVSRSPLTFGRA